MSNRDEPVIAYPVGSETAITLAELCRVFDIHADDVIELVEYGVVEPFAGQHPSQWCFPAQAMVRMRRALRLRRDLAIEPAGAALALDLIEEVRYLRARVRSSSRTTTSAAERGRHPGRQRVSSKKMRAMGGWRHPVRSHRASQLRASAFGRNAPTPGCRTSSAPGPPTRPSPAPPAR
ncbi:MAG: chaperone modulator CbpM [Halofilum sp. (in: g-proteobacteria)]|nr:chaperone modulator CbpM [Halofilum sp. (in: g-proteobacteria)]